MSSLHDSIRGALKWNEVESALNVHCHWTFSGESPPPKKKRKKEKEAFNHYMLPVCCVQTNFEFIICGEYFEQDRSRG